MSQTTLTTFFNSKKRPASDDIISTKNKIPHIERHRKVEQLKPTKKILSSKVADISLLAVNLSSKSPNKLESPVTKLDNVEKCVEPKNVTTFSRKTNLANIDKKKDLSSRESLQSARKELSLGDIKKKLAGSSRLAELRATAQRLSKGIQELQEKTDTRNLKEFKALNVDVPISPSKKNLQSNNVLLSPTKIENAVSQPSSFISPRKVVVSPVKSPSKSQKSKKFSNSALSNFSINIMNSSVLYDSHSYFYDALLHLISKYHSHYLEALHSQVEILDIRLWSWSLEYELETLLEVPAYIRHASLASASTSLPLPHHYRFLAELFRGMETVVALLYNRNEKITFAKLKPSIQEMLKRNFTEKNLGQIKHLVPDLYNFEVQKVKNFSNSANKDVYELIISPNFPSDIKIMNPSVLLERRRFFYDTLLKLVKKYHSQYLTTLDPPMEIPDSKLVRWHPEFELEKLPEVECSKLPEMPNAEKFTSAQDVLAKARELFKCNTKMERALEKLAQAKSRGLTNEEKAVTGLNNNVEAVQSAATQTSLPSLSSGITILNPALRNLPASLLEKVKAKQAAKALEAMTRSSESEEKYVIYSRLPDLARTLRNIFVTERKNVLALNVVLSKLDSSFKSNVSATELQRDIKILNECVPDLIKLHEIRNACYVKFDKTMDLQKIISVLEKKADQYKE